MRSAKHWCIIARGQLHITTGSANGQGGLHWEENPESDPIQSETSYPDLIKKKKIHTI